MDSICDAKCSININISKFFGSCSAFFNRSAWNKVSAVSNLFNLSMTPNANQAPIRIAEIKPIKFLNGNPIDVFSLMSSDLLKKAEQEPKNLEMLMLIEHLATQLESVEEEIEASRYNKVNIDHLKEQVDIINKQIEKLRNGNH